MSIFKTLTLVISVTVLFAFSGCQGSNSDLSGDSGQVPIVTGIQDSNLTSVIVLLTSNNAEVKVNNEIVNIEVKVIDDKNNPYTDGNISIVYPDDVKNGRDIGDFSESSVALDSKGIANFIYIAPSNLLENTSNINFSFYHDSNPSEAKLYTININPDPDQIVVTSYELKLDPSDGNNIMNLESDKTFVVGVFDKDGAEITQGTYAITNLNPNLGVLSDSTGVKISPLSPITDRNVNFRIESNKKSGTLPLKINVSFVDVNGDAQAIEQVFNVTILSGPPTAMSISYVATGQDEAHSQFIEEFSIKLTDKYNNPINTQPMIHVSAIAGYAKDASVYPDIKAAAEATRNSNYISIPDDSSFTNSGLYNGNILALRNDADISSYSEILSQVKIGNTINYDIADLDIYNNVFVSFGDGYSYHKSGKWDIESFDSTTDTLLLSEIYDDSSNGFDMGFAIGNNFRQDTCVFGREWVLTTESDDGTYKIDTNGYAKVKMPYDYYLTGKDVVIYANLIGDVLAETDRTLRVGEAVKVTLRGHELSPVPTAGYTIPKGSSLTPGYIFEWKLKDTSEWLKNSNFGGFDMTVSGDGAYCTNPIINDYRNCVNNGRAYISYSCAGGEDDGSVILSDGVVSTELIN